MIALNEPLGGKAAAKPKLKTKTEPTADFQEMIDLLAVYSSGENLLGILQEKLNAEMLALIARHKLPYAELQETLTKTGAALEVIARRHPEWFAAKKSIKTPYGTVKFHTGTRLEVINDEATVKLLRAEQKASPDFKAGDYIRTAEAPNLEALEAMDDATLARFMVKRVREEKFSVAAAKLEMGKVAAPLAKAAPPAVKEAAERK